MSSFPMFINLDINDIGDSDIFVQVFNFSTQALNVIHTTSLRDIKIELNVLIKIILNKLPIELHTRSI